MPAGKVPPTHVHGSFLCDRLMWEMLSTNDTCTVMLTQGTYLLNAPYLLYVYYISTVCVCTATVCNSYIMGPSFVANLLHQKSARAFTCNKSATKRGHMI